MSEQARMLLEDIQNRVEHVQHLVIAGLTNDGCSFLSTPKDIDLQTLIIIRRMLAEHIKDLKAAKVMTLRQL